MRSSMGFSPAWSRPLLPSRSHNLLGERHTRSDITHVAITKGILRLPAGTAGLKIVVAEVDNVLSVPVQAVVRIDNKDLVAVRKPDGGVDWREVTLGLTNGQGVEVEKGLETGEAIAIEPGPP